MSGVDPIAAACALIEEETAIPSLSRLAARAGLTPGAFLRAFKAATGVTPRSYAERVQGEREGAREMAEPGGARLGIAWLESRYGRVLLAGSDRGACYLGFGDPEQALRGDLRRRFPRVGFEERPLPDLLGPLRAYLDRPARGLSLPLDLRGTAFQLVVWRALTGIAVGQTSTYADLAAAIGRPGAARAVGRACALNPVSLAIPCHRMLGADGALTGYRWGMPHKRALLAAEQGGPM